MYIKAFADFASESQGGTLKEVHFIDVSREILDIVIDAHKLWFNDDTKLDFQNALQYPSSTSKAQTRKGILICLAAPYSDQNYVWNFYFR